MVSQKKEKDPKKDKPAKTLAAVEKAKIKTPTRRSARILERAVNRNNKVVEKPTRRFSKVQAQEKLQQQPENTMAKEEHLLQRNLMSTEALQPSIEAAPDSNLETLEIFSIFQQQKSAASSTVLIIEEAKSRSRKRSSDDEQANIEKASKKFCQEEDDIDMNMTNSSLDIDCSTMEIDTVDCKDIEEKKDEKIYCATCKRKLGLTAIQCRCGDFFCAKHRYSNEHDCTFDYRGFGRDEIRRNNPLLKSDKIKKI